MFNHRITLTRKLRDTHAIMYLSRSILDTYVATCNYVATILIMILEMSSNISHKMNSALLAMSLSYYYVMEENVDKEEKADEILSTLLNNNKHGGLTQEGKVTLISIQYIFCHRNWKFKQHGTVCSASPVV